MYNNHHTTQNNAGSARRAWQERLESFLRAAEADFFLAICWFETEVTGHAEGPEAVRAARADVQAAHAVLELARSEMARAIPATARTLDTVSAARVYGGVSLQAIQAEERATLADLDAFHETDGYRGLSEAYLD